MKISAHFLLSLLILLHIQSVFPTSWNGWELKELDVDATFQYDVGNWIISRYRTANAYSQCNSVYLMGGYYVLGDWTGANSGDYFRRYFSSAIVPTHSMIRFSMTFYALDNWNEKGFDLQIDYRLITGIALSQSTFAAQVCGSTSYNDATDLTLYGSFTHQQTDLNFYVISRLSSTSNTRSFGIRDFSLIFDNNGPTTEFFCARGTTATIPAAYQCQCSSKTQYYDTSSGSCQNCHIYCSSCYGPTASQCIACKPGYSWNGLECIVCDSSCDTCTGSQSSQCTRCVSGRVKYSAGGSCPQDCPFPLTKTTTNGVDYCAAPCSGYVYWDQTCSGTCAAPLQQKTVLNSITLCVYPCSPGEYLYWDGTCQAGCPSPLTSSVTKGYNFCTHPCATTTNYLYPDGTTCSATCTAPLQAKTIQGRKLCVSPCAQPSSDYLYWNGECSSSCPTTTLYTTTTNYGVKFCNYPCTGTNYRFWDQTCSTTCNPPLVPTTDRGELFCVYPTSTSDFLYWDGTSSSSCNSPLTQSTTGSGASLRQFCNYPCNIYEYLRWDGTCLLHCNAPYVRRLQWGRRFCDSPCSGTNSLFWDGSCRATSTCVAPVTSTTYGTKSVCTFPVGNYSQYLYWDGSFGATCPLPYTAVTDGTTMIRLFCKNSCTGGTPYLKWDGTCAASCPAPGSLTTVKTKQICTFPCALPQYLDWNNNCVDECNYPKITVVEGAGQYCNHPCGATTTDFYYWNSSCYSTCDIPLTQVTIDSINWCIYICEGTEYLYTNGTCSELCEAPFASKVEGNLNFCFNPCSPTEALFWNGTCFPITTCTTSPMSVVSTDMGLICEIPCASPLEFYYLATKSCITECDTESIVDMGLYLVCKKPVPVDTTTFLDMWINAPNSSVATLVTPIRVLQYARYLNVEFPPRLKRMLATKGSPILTFRFGKEMSASLKETFPLYDIPGVFSKYNLHSNFIVNFWKEMLSWLIVVALIVVLVATHELCQRYNFEKVLLITEKLVTVFKWNLMLILIAMSVPDIILYSSLQFRTTHLSSKFAGISLELAVLMIGVIAMFFTGAAYLASGLKKAKETQLDEPQAEYFDKWKGYQTIFRGYKDEKSFNFMFYLIYLFRISLPMLIASYLHMVPVLQGILYVAISILITAYILLVRPLIKFLNFIQLLIMEVTMLIVNLCLFILIALDLSGDHSSDSFVMLGDFVVGGNSLINFLFIVMFLLKIAGAVRQAFKKNKTGEDWLKGDWIEIFPIFFQQIGFGFEDISPDPKADFILYQGLLVTKKGVDARSRAEEAYKKKSRLGAGAEDKEEKKKVSWMTKLKKVLAGTPEESNLKPYTEAIHFEAPIKKSTVGIDKLNELANRRPETPASETVESEPIETQEDQDRLDIFKRVDQQRVLTIKDMLPPPKAEERAWTPNIEKEIVENEDRERNVLAYMARKGVFKEEEEASKLMVGRVPDRRKTKAEADLFGNPNFGGLRGADTRKIDLRDIVPEEDDQENDV